MLYESTRGGLKNILSAEAIKKGLADDGGLFVPQSVAKLTQNEICSLASMNYNERAVYILGRFLDDYR